MYPTFKRKLWFQKVKFKKKNKKRFIHNLSKCFKRFLRDGCNSVLENKNKKFYEISEIKVSLNIHSVFVILN
jgi:hypothetical protein